MARDRLYVRPTDHGYRHVPRWREPLTCEWSIVVGDRIRRLRLEHGLSLRELAEQLPCPRGGAYSGATLSRLERGRASSPFFVYLAIADALEVDAGRLLGPDDAARPTTHAELMLLNMLRRLRIPPDEALARIVRAGIGHIPPDPARPSSV